MTAATWEELPSRRELPCVVGRDTADRPVVVDFASTRPHTLVCGPTGSGRSGRLAGLAARAAWLGVEVDYLDLRSGLRVAADFAGLNVHVHRTPSSAAAAIADFAAAVSAGKPAHDVRLLVIDDVAVLRAALKAQRPGWDRTGGWTVAQLRVCLGLGGLHGRALAIGGPRVPTWAIYDRDVRDELTIILRGDPGLEAATAAGLCGPMTRQQLRPGREAIVRAGRVVAVGDSAVRS
jgi:hypothetical protein